MMGTPKIPWNKSIQREKKDLHSENYKMLMKKIKDDTNRWKYIYHALGWKKKYCQNG